jgi:hypothetical protein
VSGALEREDRVIDGAAEEDAGGEGAYFRAISQLVGTPSTIAAPPAVATLIEKKIRSRFLAVPTGIVQLHVSTDEPANDATLAETGFFPILPVQCNSSDSAGGTASATTPTNTRPATG